MLTHRELREQETFHSGLHELVFGLLLFGEWVLPLGDSADLSGHKREVTQGFHGHISVGDFAEPLALPDVHGHHGRVVVLHPLNVSRVAVHRHHEAVAIGHKVSHLCEVVREQSIGTKSEMKQRARSVQDSYCIWCHRQEGWRHSQNRWHSSAALCSLCRTL